MHMLQKKDMHDATAFLSSSDTGIQHVTVLSFAHNLVLLKSTARFAVQIASCSARLDCVASDQTCRGGAPRQVPMLSR